MRHWINRIVHFISLKKEKVENEKRYIISIYINYEDGGYGCHTHRWSRKDPTFTYEEALKEKEKIKGFYENAEIEIEEY